MDLIRAAMNDIEKVSCIRFVPRTNQTDYFEIENNPSCSSNVGKIGGRQVVSLLVPGCMHRGTIVHELLHVLGFWHMQSSTDRDSYIKINHENISAGKTHNFDKTDSDRFDTPYDYRSILHYGAYYFSSNGRPTIEPINRSIPIGSLGQRVAMTEGDITRLNRLYQC